MIFGYVWKDPRAINEKTQRQYAIDGGASERSTRIEKSPARAWRADLVEGDKPLMRKGDVVAVYQTRYIADDSLDFVTFLVRLAALGCGIHVAEFGETIFPDRAMSELIERDIAKRRKKQTEAGLKTIEATRRKGKKVGGPGYSEEKWPEEKRVKFRKLWAMGESYRNIADEVGVKAPTVPAIAARMKLPPRGA